MDPKKKRSRHLTWQPSDLISPLDFLKSWNYEAFQATNLPPLPKCALFNTSKSTTDASEREVKTEEKVILDQIAKVMAVSEETIKELSDVCG